MFAHWNRMQPKTLESIVVSASLVGLIIAGPPAFARILVNVVDPLALVADDDRHIVVTGSTACTAGERSYLRVIVTQRSTGAIAEGRALIDCSGEIQQWEVDAAVQDAETFQPGPATAVGVERTSALGKTTSIDSWLVDLSVPTD